MNILSNTDCCIINFQYRFFSLIIIGVPLIDGGTVRLPMMIGLSPALDLILTGREVLADEGLRIG